MDLEQVIIEFEADIYYLLINHKIQLEKYFWGGEPKMFETSKVLEGSIEGELKTFNYPTFYYRSAGVESREGRKIELLKLLDEREFKYEISNEGIINIISGKEIEHFTNDNFS